MGTSTSSKGGGPRSPFDPEWLSDDAGDTPNKTDLSDVEDGNPTLGDPSNDNPESEETTAQGKPESINSEPVQHRRFAEARSKMTTYLSGGGRDSLRSAAKSMVNRGMGGPRRAARTMSPTAQGAGQLGQFLASARDRTDPAVVDWVDKVRAENLSANDLALELVQEVLPNTGSVDDESLRNAAAEAIGKLYEIDPNIDIFALSDQQIADVIGFTVANDVCNRMDLLLGQTYERLKYDPQQVQMYRNDVKEYVHAEIRIVMKHLSAKNLDPKRLASEVLSSALKVFSE